MKRLLLKCVAVTALVFLMMVGLSRLTDLNLFNAFDPISTALEEFELTDYVFSKLREVPQADERIVIVNIAPSRRAVAEQLRIISQYNPKVIGIDAFFNCEGGLTDTINCPQVLDTLGNLLLANAIEEAGNVVLVSRLLQTDSLFEATRDIELDVYPFDSLEYSDQMFSFASKYGFANLNTGATYQEDVKICKSFAPSVDVDGSRELAFAVKLAQAYDSAKVERFLARGNEEELINFRGNAEIPDVKIAAHRAKMEQSAEFRVLCYAIDWPQLFNGEYLPVLFENSVVIIGYLGEYYGDPSWHDKFFTPLNSKVAGRANPDMFGAVVHANIVSMILNEDYIEECPDWLLITIAIVLCLLNIWLFDWVDKAFPVWYDALSVFLQFAEIVILLILILEVFENFNLKMDLTLSIAALALIGPCFDVYKGFENTIIGWLTRKGKWVLTPQKR